MAGLENELTLSLMIAGFDGEASQVTVHLRNNLTIPLVQKICQAKATRADGSPWSGPTQIGGHGTGRDVNAVSFSPSRPITIT